MSEKIVQLNEEVIKGQIKEGVRGSGEETLNGLLEKEAQSPFAGRQVSVCLRGWHLPAAQLGRGVRKYGRSCGKRRQCGQIP